MLKFKKSIKFILSAAFIVSLLIALLSIVSVEYRKGAASQLPASCKKWSLQRMISSTCMTEIALMKKAPVIEHPICYDNDNYIDCRILAKDILNSKQSLAGFTTLSFLTGALATLNLRRWSKQ